MLKSAIMTNNMLKTLAENPTDAIFGLQPDGEIFKMPISTTPHMIIAGQTGSGKSVYVNALLISMISHATPEELQIFWIDPKKVEATAYIQLPYCPTDPIINMADAYGLIYYLIGLMEERYEILSETKTKNLEEYNKWYEKNLESVSNKWGKMPYIICVIDEFADLIEQFPEIEKGIQRLCQKARAAGIHLIICTQRPSVNVITGNIKANIPTRICLKVADGINSHIILDDIGGEKLRGNGDSLIKSERNDSFMRVQGLYISNEEIETIFKSLREKYGKPKFIDYKQKCVDWGYVEWENEYAENIPWDKKHVVPVGNKKTMTARQLFGL